MAEVQSMHLICRVLLCLANNGPLTTKEICGKEELDYNQVKHGLRQLLIKKKISRVGKDENKNGYIYEYNEEYVPQDRVKAVRSKTVQGFMGENCNKNKTLMFAPRFREQKIAAVTRLLPKASPEDKDLLIGIISDYKRM